ncbi:MAG: hypothetical protein K9G72_21530 [Rhodobacteraceae bacterium]|nr:hypothetical protein [Paracoccaceae bacterium]
MAKRKLIVNLGLARCGTTATEDYFRSLSDFSTPEGVKELKFFLRPRKPTEYLKHFKYTDASILFESSPPYMHSGMDKFCDVIARIAALRDHGFDVYLLVNIRNLLKRAFSHYWHDINGHHAIFGKYWGVLTPDDPRRFESVYQTGFTDELLDPDSQSKFLPEIGQMLHHAISVMGSDRVRLALTTKLDEDIDSFLNEVAPDLGLAPTKTRRIPGTKAPAYLYGGERGASFPAALLEGTEEVHIPAHFCVLVARRHLELLSATTYDLRRITAAEATWTKTLKADAIPQRVLDYLAGQRTLLSALPSECFLSCQPDQALDEIFAIPQVLSVATTVPVAKAVKKLVWERQVSEAERDGKVMVGRSGRLFLHHDMNSVMAQHSGELLLSDQETQIWTSTLAARTQKCSALGLRYEMIFAPDTHAVYREDISLLDTAKGPRPIQQVLSAYREANLHYPLAEMRKARSFGEVCQETDSHWSAFGAFVAYRSVMQRMGMKLPVPAEGEYQLQDKELVGDLGGKFDPPRAGRTTEVVIPQHSRKVWNNGVTNRGHMSLWIGKKRQLPKALLLTDSYGWKFQVFLAQSFSDLFVVHSPIFEPEAIERFKPDVVISLLAERFAYKVPKDSEDPTAIQNATQKAPGAAYPDFSEWVP